MLLKEPDLKYVSILMLELIEFLKFFGSLLSSMNMHMIGLQMNFKRCGEASRCHFQRSSCEEISVDADLEFEKLEEK